jgi:hypothetical protein
MTINPTETATWPLATPVSRGANGAPGHTPTRRNPKATKGLTWNAYKSEMEMAGTKK